MLIISARPVQFSLMTIGHKKAEYHILKGGHEGVNQNLLAMVLGKHEQFVAGIINSLISQGKVKLVGKIIIHMDRFKSTKCTSTFLADFHKTP